MFDSFETLCLYAISYICFIIKKIPMGKLLVANLFLLLIVASFAMNLEASHDVVHRGAGHSTGLDGYRGKGKGCCHGHGHGNGQRGNPLTEKLVGTNRFKSIKDNKFHQVDNLVMDLQLKSSRYVQISYGINGYAPYGDAYLVTALEVDGEKVKQFIHITGYTHFVHNKASNKIYLKAGKHKLRVVYRTLYEILADEKQDWQVGFLKVIY